MLQFADKLVLPPIIELSGWPRAWQVFGYENLKLREGPSRNPGVTQHAGGSKNPKNFPQGEHSRVKLKSGSLVPKAEGPDGLGVPRRLVESQAGRKRSKGECPPEKRGIESHPLIRQHEVKL